MSRGSVRKRGDSWRARYRDDQNRDRQRTFARKADADAWVRDQLAAVASGTHVDPSAGTMTFSTYAAQWQGMQHVRERTSQLHEGRVRNYLNPVIGTVPLKGIRRSHVVEVVRRCTHDLGLSPLVTRYTISTLRAVLESAVRDQLIPRNVAADRTIQLPKRERATGTLDADQVARIVERMEDRYTAMVIVGAASGLRPSELAALTVDRCRGLASLLTDGGVVDMHRATSVVLRVDRQISAQRTFIPPKSTSSVRDVPVPDNVAAVLVDHVRRFGLGDSDLVFSTPTGKVLGSPHMSKAWAKATAGLVLPDGSWHQLRHFHASSLLSDGVSIAAVAKRLGHSSATVTLAHYAWAMPSDEQRVLDASAGIAARLA